MADSVEVEFTAPAVKEGEISEYSFHGEGTSVLLFFPGAFTAPCRNEMVQFQEAMEEFENLDAELIGVSVDTPFSLKHFASENDLEFRLVSDHSKHIVENYGVKTDFEEIGFYGLSERAVFIVEDGEVVWSRVMEDPENLPEVRDVLEALQIISD